jgi:integrase
LEVLLEKREVDWKEDIYITRWLSPRYSKTKEVYWYAIEKYIDFTGIAPQELIEEKYKDTLAHPLQKTYVAERRFAEFDRWMSEIYEKKKEWVKNKNDVRLAEKTRVTYLGAIMSFYRFSGVPLDTKPLGRRGQLNASTKKDNRTYKMNAFEVEMLADTLPTLRDKALTWLLFQTGLDISRGLALNWGDVVEEFRHPPLTTVELDNGIIRDVPSVMLDVTRSKGGMIEHRTYLCQRAIETLKKYLTDRHGSNFTTTMDWNEPLFVSTYGIHAGERYSISTFEKVLRRYAPLTGLITAERIENSTRQPLRPASLRASFSNALKSVSCDPDYIDFWMGHVTRYGGAYSDAERGLYCKFASQALEPTSEADMKRDIVSLQRELAEYRQKYGELQDLLPRLKKLVEKEVG